MASTKGITIVANFGRDVTFTDEWVELAYESLENTMTVVSTDLLFDEDEGTMTVVLGIECSDGLDSDSLVHGVARDALTIAIEHANGGERLDTASFPIIVPGNVDVFV